MLREENFAVRLSKNVSLNVKKAGKTFSCPFLFIYPLFKKRTTSLGENSCKRNYFLDGKHSMGNFDTPDLHRFL